MDKQCSKCKEVKSIDNFYKHRTNKDGYWGCCKGCHYQYEKEYIKYNINPDDRGRLINRGWIEALQFVQEHFDIDLRTIKQKGNK